MFMENKTEKKQTVPKKPEVSGSECSDKNCPIHGSLKLRGRTFTEKVVGAKAHGTATIEIERRHHIPKYERYEKYMG